MLLVSIFVFLLGLSNNPEVVAQDANNPSVPATEPAQQPAPTQAPAGSDAPAEAKEPPTPPHTGFRAMARGLGEDFKNLPAKENMYLALMGGALAAGAHPVDQSFNARLQPLHRGQYGVRPRERL